MPRREKKSARADLIQAVCSTIRQAIFEQRLKPGDRLRETALSRELQISRTPIREALRYLEQEGLVHRAPYRGVHVACSMSEEEIRRVYRVRAVLEGMAVEDARQNLQAAHRIELRNYLKAMRAAADKGDLAELHRNDMAFHRYIWKLAGDPVLERLLSTLCQQSFVVYSVQSLPQLSREELDDLVNTHFELLDLFDQTDTNVAGRVKEIQDRSLATMVNKLFRFSKSARSS